MNTNIKKEIGQRIRSLRKRRGMTQEEMADNCGLHWTYIGGLERGERNPTLTTMQKIAGGLGISVQDLLDVPRESTIERDTREGRLLKMLRRKDENTLDLAAGLVREVINWRDRYSTKKLTGAAH